MRRSFPARPKRAGGVRIVSQRRALEERLVAAGSPAVPRVRFFASGTPATKGSTVPFQDSQGRMRVTNDNERTAAWSERAGLLARAAGARPGLGPARAVVRIALLRPASHYGTGRNAGTLKASAPRWPMSKPDVDKVVRAVLDALTFIAWVDDAQVVDLRVIKAFAATAAEEGVTVTIAPIREEAAA